MTQGMASNLVWISRILRARAVCWFRETEAGIVNGAGGAKDFVESSALWKTSEDNGRCMVMGTLLQLVTVYVVEDNISSTVPSIRNGSLFVAGS